MNASEIELIRTVKSDLMYIKRKWNQKIDDDDLRRDSIILRRLLVNDDFGKAWRLVGFSKQPKVEYFDGSQIFFKDVLPGNIVFALSGGANYQGCEVAGFRILNFAMTPAHVKERSNQLPIKSEAALSSFLRSCCIVAQGEMINRSDLISYIANKLGGAHFDNKRSADDIKKKFDKLDEIRDRVNKLINRSGIHNIKSGKKAQLLIMNISFEFFELLSIGQAVALAKDTEAFLKRADCLIKIT